MTAGTLLGIWGPAQMSQATRWGLLLLAVALSLWATYAIAEGDIMLPGPDWQWIIGVAGLVISTLVGWLYAGIISRLDKLAGTDQQMMAGLTALQVEIARDYVRRSEHTEVMRQVLAKLDRIEEQVARKADRA